MALEAAMAAAAVAGAYSAYSSNENAKQQANSQKQMAEYNQKVAQSNAELAIQQGGQQEEAQRREARQALGQQRAALAESGIGLDGTGGDLYQQSAADAELDALNIRYNADLQAASFKNNASLDGYQAQVYGKQAKDYGRAAAIGVGTALLSSTASYVGYRAKIKESKAGLQQ